MPSESSPLCPHCYRPACPWLTARRAATLWHRGLAQTPTRPEVCPFYGQPLPPLVQEKLTAALRRGGSDAS